MRQREDHVHIGNIQQFLFTRRQPLVTSIGLTLCAMAVPARVVRDGLMAAARALIQMAAERRRAAALDGAQHAEMLPGQSGSILLDEALCLLRERCRPPRRVARSSLVQFAGALRLFAARRTRPCRWACPPLSDDVRKDAGKWRSLSGRSARAATALSASLPRSPASASRSYGAANGGERLW